ncbi:uncharacterized protein KY384_008917 [Bacidia gigantensis]|uniref:uncharacterized protein n=1 Tax=Bacidia gigantensis TaxID=2732470 RepID=UPI001D04E954|nr:uncharacterized protein KY384_008917 [Bacidia gigantensis]KAG8525273.1 hypothetical protein KY384_008917 [Bacidia gigantensis]
MITPGSRIIEKCMSSEGALSSGGWVLVGDRQLLTLHLMAPDSGFARVLQQVDASKQAFCESTAQRSNYELGLIGYAPCNGQSNGNIPKGPEIPGGQFSNIVLNDPSNVFTVPHDYSVPKEPACGASCTWPSNSCGGGCHCVADPLQNLVNTGARFKGTCKDSYFAFLSRRRILSFTPDETPDTVVVLVDGPEPEPDAALDPPTASGVQFNRLGNVVSGALACACNCTYVSVGCCTAPDSGFIQEYPWLKLGVMDPPEGQCCDAGSGQFREGVQGGGNDTTCYATA